MKRLIFLILAVSLLFAFSFSKNLNAAIMEDYCQAPPYVIQNIPPNIMVVLDSSGSMFNFAYFDGFNTTTTSDDNMCSSSSSPCTGFTTPGTYPTFKYYGYFDPDYWYTYSTPRFVPSAPKTGSGLPGARAKYSTEWDGNFLSWVTMRRVDILRKVLTGGKTTSGEGANYNRLIGEIADCDARGKYKQIAMAELYTPYSGGKTFTVNTFSASNCSGGGAGTSSFSVSGVAGSFNVAVRVPSPVEGVLQSVVGTRARLGLTFYNVNAPTPQGGKVARDIRGYNCPAGGGSSMPCVVNDINNSRPNSNTPLGETLWTVTGYFAQQASMESGPGPRYNSGDYQINNNNDPYNYGTGGQPRYPSCAKSYVLYLTDGEPCADGYLPVAINDYASGKSAYNCSGTSCPAVAPFPASTFPSCYGGGESASCYGVVSGCYVAGIEDVALYTHTTDLRSSTLGVSNISGIQNLTLYAVFAFGKGSTLLRYAAINGGFEDINNNNIPDLQSEWDQNNDNEPDNFYEADEGYALEQGIKSALSTILKRASSGTAASVLASGEGSGANLIQAVFYPKRRFGNDMVGWVGEDQNLWYYIDPFFTYSNIREDTVPDKILHMIDDYIAWLYFDPTEQMTKALRSQDTDGDGDPDVQMTPVPFENLGSIWKAGELLWSRDITTDPRTIYTTIDGTNLLAFSTGNAPTLVPYLNATDVNGNGSKVEEAEDIIRYTQGEGLTTVDLDDDGINDIIGVDRNGDGIDDYRPRYAPIGTEKHVWKLGDILNSTPRVTSWIPLQNYDIVYDDRTYGPGTKEDRTLPDSPNPNYYITTTTYKDRGMVFVGGNDGMLHALKLGKLELSWDTQNKQLEKARLTGTDIGKEMWTFIPKNALPYLKYMMETDYCHVYTVDLPPYLVDASINKPTTCTETDYWSCMRAVESWRTIIIGGMRWGGACRGTTTTCSDVSGDSQKDCVNTPVDVDGSSVGYSSYFALDVTDQNNPQLLWEFSHPELGFATTGPVVMRISSKNPNGSTNYNSNGRWFVALGSGPTGPISTADYQFMGRSDQNLKFFVLDLKTGNLLRTIDTGIQYAFAGSMLNSSHDVEYLKEDYQDDAFYVGYVKRTGTNPNYTWTDGGVGRLLTKESLNVNDWEWSIVMDGIGPVTTAIAHLREETSTGTRLWLYFGTGRYFYQQGATADDGNSQRRLFGIKEPCYYQMISNLSCNTTVNFSDLTDVTTPDGSINAGWYINLESAGSYTHPPDTAPRSYGAERVITDPLASTMGVVFFTTFKPYLDECAMGGKSFLWAVAYGTGGSAGALLKGKALLQMSTASIEQVDLGSAFTEKEGRRTSGMEGVPPTGGGLSILKPPTPVKRMIHMRER